MTDVLLSARVGLILAFAAAALFFTFVSMVGVIRLPDVYSRAHTASQADTLGAGFALAAIAFTIGWDAAAFKTVLLLFFIFVTNPTAAHAIVRAAFEEGVVPWTEPGADTPTALDRDDLPSGDSDVAADGGAASQDAASQDVASHDGSEAASDDASHEGGDER